MWSCRQGRQCGLLLGEVLAHDPLGRGMQPNIGDRVQPFAELQVQVISAAERATEEEVLTDIAVGPFDLALGFRPIGPTCTRQSAVMVQQGDQRPIVHHDTLGILIDHRGFHAVVEHFRRGTAHRIEGVDVAANNRLQILGRTEPAPQPAAVAPHHREQPEDPRHTRLIAERYLELGEVDLGLPSRRCFEAPLELDHSRRAALAQEVRDGRIAALEPHSSDFAEQSLAGQPGIQRDAIAKIRFIGFQLTRTRWSGLIYRRLHAAVQMFAYRLAVKARLPRNRDTDSPCRFMSWIMTISSSLITSHASRRSGKHRGDPCGALPIRSGARPGANWRSPQTGEFSFGTFGENTSGIGTGRLPRPRISGSMGTKSFRTCHSVLVRSPRLKSPSRRAALNQCNLLALKALLPPVQRASPLGQGTELYNANERRGIQRRGKSRRSLGMHSLNQLGLVGLHVLLTRRCIGRLRIGYRMAEALCNQRPNAHRGCRDRGPPSGTLGHQSYETL